MHLELIAQHTKGCGITCLAQSSLRLRSRKELMCLWRLLSSI